MHRPNRPTQIGLKQNDILINSATQFCSLHLFPLQLNKS